jgi:3-hydroxyacyl-CoA dehydrogenase
MHTDIKKVAVIGAGVMGAGIAAQVANAGIPVVLLDIVPKDPAADRNGIAAGAVEKMLKTQPAAFMSKAAAKLVTTGNIEDHLELLADCDWIVEAIIERLDLKQALYAKIEKVRKAGSVVSSNTSTIPLAKLIEGLPPRFGEDFIITHFFNPPRYMRLLEIVAGAPTRASAVESIDHFAEIYLGKSCVHCKDRPGFIANRLGVLWLQASVVEAIDLGLDVEEADAIVGPPMGIPKTGVFGLLDLVGLDIMPHVNASMAASLPKSDLFHVYQRPLPLVDRMIKDGYTGRKGKGGFYRVNRDKGKAKEAIDLQSGEYRAQRKARLDIVKASGKKLTRLLDDTSKYGRYAWRVLGPTLAYAATLVGDAADEVESFDEAMRLGYNWKFGPFELIDQIGVDWLIKRLEKEGLAVPAILRTAAGRTFYRVENGERQVMNLDGSYRTMHRPEGEVMLSDIKLKSKPVLKNGSAAVWDIGDGVLCFEFTSKMNSMDPDILALLGKTIALVAKSYKALVIYNEGSNFSVGANLGLALFAANVASWDSIDQLIAAGQQTYKALKYAPFPVVGAPAGMALGGGCEILLHCSAIQAYAETYAGLVEVGVGLLPGWGGCKEMLARWQQNNKMPKGPMPAVSKVFEMISTAAVSKSAAEAKEMLILRPSDGITMNRYRLLVDAKEKALAMAAAGYQPPKEPLLNLPGPSGATALAMAVHGFAQLGKATPHDVTVSSHVATVLSGGDCDVIEPVSEDQVLALERAEFMKLARNPASIDRIEHMLETGKPLRN